HRRKNNLKGIKMAEDKKPKPVQEDFRKKSSDTSHSRVEKTQRQNVTNTRPSPPNQNGHNGKGKDRGT
ncbi:MAG: hypothetical protein KKD65_14520, partial [Gammaproteobacteria bacterium]|nr:hypothetical protein [Gammaproteobacteria bacterium]